MRLSLSFAGMVLLPLGYAIPQLNLKPGEHDGDADSPTTAARRAQAVKDAFLFAWNGYHEHAFPHDELHPVSNGFSDSRNGWGASAVDALSTACVMGLSDVVNDILAFIPSIDFSTTTETVNLFETTIRYLGGMLAGYDLLTGPQSHLVNSTNNVDVLLKQSETLGDLLSFAFDTPTGIPNNNLNFTTDKQGPLAVNGLATIGSLVLEWTHLSDLTGNKTYAKLSQKGESYLLNPIPAVDMPYHGLVGTNVNITSGTFLDATGGWVGGDDSFYEYLLKMYVYDSSRFGNYLNRWTIAADSSINYLASQPPSRPDLTFLAEFNNHSLIFESEHLSCFDGGNFLLGGQVLGRQDYIDFGLSLVSACHDTYASTVTGIGPEIFSWDTTALPENQTAFFEQNGFYITDSVYVLRPEVLESYYYAYRITGDTKYQNWAWDGFQSIVKSCKANSGFSGISDVNTVGGGSKDDRQESFLFAEVLKYAYLIHAPEKIYDVNVNGTNQWVFNTEAHPFRVVGPPV